MLKRHLINNPGDIGKRSVLQELVDRLTALAAVAGYAGGEKVPGCSFTLLRHGDDMVKGHGQRCAVGAAPIKGFENYFLSFKGYGINSALASPGVLAPLRTIARVFCVTGSRLLGPVWSTGALANITGWQPQSTFTTPRFSNRTMAVSISFTRSIGCTMLSIAFPTSARQPIPTTTITAKFGGWSPLATLLADVLTCRDALLILIQCAAGGLRSLLPCAFGCLCHLTSYSRSNQPTQL